MEPTQRLLENIMPSFVDINHPPDGFVTSLASFRWLSVSLINLHTNSSE